MRLHAALFAGVIVFAIWAGPAGAQAQAVVPLSFTVTESAHNQPIPGARVALLGPVVLVGFSDAAGQVQFDTVPAGEYRARVSKLTFISQTTNLFSIGDIRSAHFDVSLGSSTLKTIGSIKARPADNENSIAPDSTLRRLAPSLGDALSYLPGVQTGSGGGAQVTGISINGHDPRETGLSIDGVPAFGNGTRLNADLFGSLTVTNEPEFGFLGGNVNLRTVDPALAHSSLATLQNGFADRNSFTALDRGTVGSVGYSALHTERNVASGLLGQTFLDTSGFDYSHAGVSRSTGNVAKIRTTLGPNQTLTAVALESHYSEDLVCATQSGALPCGYGPGNRAFGDIRRFQLDDVIVSGSMSIRLTAFATRESDTTDFSRRYLGGLPTPSDSADDIVSRGATFELRLRPRRHALALSGYVIGKDERLSSATAGAADSSASSTMSRVALSDSFQIAKVVTARLVAGTVHASSAAANAEYAASLTYVPNGLDRYSFDLTTGAIPTTELSQAFVTSPSALVFDCNAKSATGSGPGDSVKHATSTTMRAGWNRSGNAYRANVQLYRQSERGALVAVPLNAGALSPLLFPGGAAYFDAASAAYSRQPGCAPATLTPADVYLNVPIAASRTYQGLNASLAIAISPRLAVQGAYTIQSATITSSDPRLDNPYSYVVGGSQLPNVPLHLARAAISWKPANGDLTVVAGARHTSANNANNLPAYTAYSAAVDMKLRHGHLQLAADNLTNAFSGSIATPANALPLARRGVAPLRTVATPLRPRAVYLTYTLAGGAPLPARALASPDQDVSSEITLALTAFGQPAGANPFQIDKTNANCFINEARVAERLLHHIDDAVARARQERRARGSEATLPIDETGDVKLAYRNVGESFAITVTATSAAAMRALASCAYIHYGTREEEEALGLYLPARGENLDFVFMPSVGLYTPLFLRGGNAKRPGTETQRFTALPTKPPAQPLKLSSASSCTAAARPAAETYLTALAAFAKAPSGAAPSAPDGWTFKRHAAPGGAWIETSTPDAALRSAVVQCALVAGGTAQELIAVSALSAPYPAINYADRFGLYARLQ